MNRISLWGVVIGNLVDIVSSLTIASLAAFLIAAVYALNYRQPLDPSVLKESGTFLAVSSILGAFCSILAGYVSARIAKHDEILNGALSSVFSIGIAAYSMLDGSETHMALEVAALPLSVLLGAFGGYLSYRRRVRKPA